MLRPDQTAGVISIRLIAISSNRSSSRYCNRRLCQS